MSRKSKLTPEAQEKILRHLRIGAYVETAAAAAGISRDTFDNWLKRGAEGKAPYAAFAEAVDQAVAESEARDLATILAASKTQWQAAAWRLERRFPEKYGRHDRTKVEGKIDVGVSGAELASKLARLLAAASQEEDPGGAQQDGAEGS
jgi:transposase